jgi:hypothetical protein
VGAIGVLNKNKNKIKTAIRKKHRQPRVAKCQRFVRRLLCEYLLAENEVRKMSEMPNLEVWQSATVYLRDNGTIRMSFYSYAKAPEANYTDSTCVNSVDIMVQSIEAYEELVADLSEKVAHLKAKAAELTEVA